jgi:hypothetical protein
MESNKSLIFDLDKVSANLRTYLLFVKLVESLSGNKEDFEKLVHQEVEFRELPNLLNKNGQVRTLEASLEGFKKAKMILSEQNFAIKGYAENDATVVVEKIWTGKMSTDIGNLKKGQELKAYICAVVEFKDGKIYRHRSYDCYEPFG